MTLFQKYCRKLGRFLFRISEEPTYPPLEHFPDAPDIFRYYRSFLTRPALKRMPGGWEYQNRFYPDYLMVGGASHMIARTALTYCKGDGIDIGAGLWPLAGATAVDVWRGPGAGRTLADFRTESVDYVFSSHCLEHVEDWQKELDGWLRPLKRGGIIFLYLPHPECGIWNPGSPMVGDGHKWQPTPAIIKSAFAQRGCEIVAFDDGPDPMMSFFVCGRKQ